MLRERFVAKFEGLDSSDIDRVDCCLQSIASRRSAIRLRVHLATGKIIEINTAEQQFFFDIFAEIPSEISEVHMDFSRVVSAILPESKHRIQVIDIDQLREAGRINVVDLYEKYLDIGIRDEEFNKDPDVEVIAAFLLRQLPEGFLGKCKNIDEIKKFLLEFLRRLIGERRMGATFSLLFSREDLRLFDLKRGSITVQKLKTALKPWDSIFKITVEDKSRGILAAFSLRDR